MTPKSPRTRFVYFIIFVLIFFAVAPFILLYSFGYNWTQNFSLLKTGGIYVYSSEVGAQLYVNNRLDDSTSVFQRGLLVKDLRPNIYSIKLAKEGYIDWIKNIEVKEERVAEAYPFLIPRKISATPVPSLIPKSSTASSTMITNPDYKEYITLFSTTSKSILPKKTTTASSSLGQAKPVNIYPNIENKKLVIEKRGNDLYAVWQGSEDATPFYFCIQKEDSCVKEFLVYSALNIGAFNFYPSRNDVIFVVVDSKIMIVELDKRLPQNIVELYESPVKDVVDFRIIDNENIVVKDGKKIIKISLVYAKQ